MATVSGERMLRALGRLGWTLHHVRGSHHYLVGPGAKMVCIPVHKGRTLKQKTARSILAVAGVSEEAFFAVY